MNSIVKSIGAGLLGFDVDQPLTATDAVNFKANGYDFCLRYIPRTVALIKGNLTLNEIGIILNAGLSLSAVQHVCPAGWLPSGSLGKQYGAYAGQYAAEVGLPTGMNIWLDLEGVEGGSKAIDVIDYCKSWYDAVASAGYLPAIYVGWNAILTPQQLYSNLPFKHYWRAYNGPDVATRGFQIIQETQKMLNGISFDPNKSQIDNIGDSAIFLSPS
jgi:hypothetical protein